MHFIIWKYSVSKETQSEFENEYGPNGTWYKFFKTSDKYLGSFLHISKDESLTYLLIDNWADIQSYQDFIASNNIKNLSLSEQFEKLYIVEELIGNFNSLQ